MAQQFEVQALGLNDIPYQIEIYNDNYGGANVTQLDGDQQFIRFEGGQRERVGIEPIWGKEVRINLRTNEDLSPLFGLEDRDAEVRVFRTDTSSLVWKGFILTDLFQDEPLTDLPGVELRAVDGLTTLEADSFDALSGVSDSDIGDDGSFIRYTDIFTGILSTLYDSPLDIEFAVEWYPDAGGQLSSSDNPLEYSGARPDVYYDSEDGEWFDQQTALEDALQSQGLEARQAVIGGNLRWLIAQPSALSAGPVKTWRYSSSGTLLTGPNTRNFTLDLSTADTDRPTREFERRSESAAVTHDHAELENVVSNGGFEDPITTWSLSSSSNFSTSRVEHETSSFSPRENVQNNTFVAEIQQTNFPTSGKTVTGFEQFLGEFSGLPPKTNARLSLKSNSNELQAERVGLEIGGLYLGEFEVNVASSSQVENGTGTIPVNNIDRRIPEGARLPIYVPSNGSLSETVSSITLTKEAAPGSSELEGDITEEVPSNAAVVYYGLKSTQSEVSPFRFKPGKDLFYGSSEFVFSVTDGSGNVVTGDTYVRLKSRLLTASFKIISIFDDVSLEFTVDGQPVTATTEEASVPQNGQERGVSVRLSSGPSTKNPRRVKGLAPGGFSYQATDWGIGQGGGSLSLAGLQARERLRYLREHLERQQLTVYARNKSPVVTGEEVVQFDGKTWRIAEFSSDPASGEIGLTLIQHADAGTTDLTIETVRDTEDGGATGGGGTVPAVGGGGGGAAGVEVIQLDASGGNVTETLPAPSSGATALALRVDTSTGNTATLDTPGTEEIRFAEGKNVSSTTLAVEQSLLLSSDGSHWYVEEGQGLRAEAETVTTDGVTKDSPLLKQTATYDSDASSGVTSSDVSIERYVRTDNNGNATLVYESGGTEIARLSSAGRFETRKDQEAFMDGSLNSGSGTNSLLQVEDAGNPLTTDAASINFVGSGVTVTEPNPDEIKVDVSGGSSGSTSLSGLNDVSSALQNDGNVLATGGGNYREEDITTLTQQHVDLNHLSDVGTAGVTDGNILIADGVNYNAVGLDVAAGNHLDLADLKSAAYSSLSGTPVVPSAGDGLSDNSGDFDIKPSDFAGHGLEDDGSDNLRIDGANIGTGLNGGDGTDLSVDVVGLSGFGIEAHNNAFRLDNAGVGGGLTGGGGNAVSVNEGDGLEVNTGELEVALKTNGGLNFDNGEIEVTGGTGMTNWIFDNNSTAATLDDGDTLELDLSGSALTSSITAGTSTHTVEIDLGLNSVGKVELEDDSVDEDIIASTAMGGGLDGGGGVVLQVDGGDGISVGADVEVDSTVARTDQSELFDDQVRIDGPQSGNDNTIGSSQTSYALALGGEPHGINDTDGTGDDRQGDGLLQTAHGSNSDYRTYLQGGHGRVAHVWNAYYDDTNSTWRSIVDNEPHSLLGLGNNTPGNTTGGGVTLATASSSASAEDSFNWDVGLHVNVDGDVGVRTTNPDFPFQVDVASGNQRDESGEWIANFCLDGDSLSIGTDSVGTGSSNAVILKPGTTNTPGRPDLYLGSTSGSDIAIDAGSGKVGVGGITSPSYAIHVSGDIRATAEVEAFLSSDRRLKTALTPLDSALDKIGQLTGYGFDWKDSDSVQPHKRAETDVGLVAQEVEEVLPEAVKKFQDGHSEGYKGVSYDKLVPLLIEAIKDLRNKVEA